jgi:hypothetical protein
MKKTKFTETQIVKAIQEHEGVARRKTSARSLESLLLHFINGASAMLAVVAKL